MACTSKNADGSYRVFFYDKNNKRKAIRLGQISDRAAKQVLDMVKSINDANIAQSDLKADVAAWVKSIGDKLHAKLTRVGLVTPRGGSRSNAGKLGPFL